MQQFWNMFIIQMKAIEFTDIIDIALVALLLYLLLNFIRERRAGKLAIGVALLIVVQIISTVLDLHAMKFILQNIFQVGLIALVVVFQPELRSVLEKIGTEPIKGIKNIGNFADSKDNAVVSHYIKEICDAAADLSAERTGALIIIERNIKLGDVIKSGTIINADISSFLLRNIFFNKAPLHDGALIIRNWRLHAAGCFLPLSTNESIIKDLGTRHRAGIGMSEVSDAIVIIISEETGLISIASKGELRRGYTYNTLKLALEEIFFETSPVKKIVRSSHGKNDDTDTSEKE